MSPPVIWLNVWIANGAVPSEAGSRSAYTRSVVARLQVRGFRSLSTRCAQMICSVVVMPPRGVLVRPVDRRGVVDDRRLELPAADGEDAAAAPDLFFLRRQRDGS